MKQYYYLKGKDQNGPFTFEELQLEHLTNETLVWSEGMENWINLKELPELVRDLKLQSVPPPPPSDKAISPNTLLTWVVIWSSIHLFALITAYCNMGFSSITRSESRTEKFWPFVKFSTYPRSDGWWYYTGIFTDYDWSEFLIYVGAAWIILLLSKISKQN